MFTREIPALQYLPLNRLTVFFINPRHRKIRIGVGIFSAPVKSTPVVPNGGDRTTRKRHVCRHAIRKQLIPHHKLTLIKFYIVNGNTNEILSIITNRYCLRELYLLIHYDRSDDEHRRHTNLDNHEKLAGQCSKFANAK